MIKKGDFIEIDYTARLKDDKIVFDTTSQDVAKTTEHYNPKYKYEPLILCVGEKHVLPGLDDFFVGKKEGKYTVEIGAEMGFGKKRADLLKLIPLKLFKKDEVQPYPGLDVSVDGQTGIVRSVSGGRVIVDFNHPLSSKDLVYEVEIKRVVTDHLEQVKSMIKLMHLPYDDIDIIENKATIHLKAKLPEEITKHVAAEIRRLTKLDTDFTDGKKLEKPAEEPKKDL